MASTLSPLLPAAVVLPPRLVFFSTRAARAGLWLPSPVVIGRCGEPRPPLLESDFWPPDASGRDKACLVHFGSAVGLARTLSATAASSFVSDTLRCPIWTSSVSAACRHSRDWGDTSAGSQISILACVMGSKPLEDGVSWMTTTLVSPPGALATTRRSYCSSTAGQRPSQPHMIAVEAPFSPAPPPALIGILVEHPSPNVPS